MKTKKGSSGSKNLISVKTGEKRLKLDTAETEEMEDPFKEKKKKNKRKKSNNH